MKSFSSPMPFKSARGVAVRTPAPPSEEGEGRGENSPKEDAHLERLNLGWSAHLQIGESLPTMPADLEIGAPVHKREGCRALGKPLSPLSSRGARVTAAAGWRYALVVFSVLFLAGLTLPAAELPLLLRGETLPVLAAPSLKEPLTPEWKIAHGTYEPKDGVLVCAEKPENKHVAVLWHEVPWNTGVIECEFRFDGARVLLLGCDGKLPTGLTHVGRVVISPKQISLAEDSVKPSHTLAKQAADLAPGQWHKLRFEWQGDQIAVRVNDVTVQTKHDYLRTEKTRSWIAIGGNSLSIRGLKISGKP